MNWTNDLEAQLDRCRSLTTIDMQNKTPFELFASIGSEMGELGQELCTEDKVFGNTHREVDEGSKIESVDLIISTLAMYFARGGTFQELPEIMKSKLDKWEGNIS